MSGVIAFLASSLSDGSQSLPRSDCAAVAWARKTGPAVVAYFPPGDWLAAEYALAAECEIVEELEIVLASPWKQAWIGGGFLERVGDEFAARLAERRSAALLFDVLRCGAAPDGTHTIVRDAGRGAREEITAVGPLVLVVSPTVQRTGYVSRFRRQQARMQLSASGANRVTATESLETWQPARPRTRRAARAPVESAVHDRMDTAFGITAAKESTATQTIAADPPTCAQHLLRYLAHHGLWQRSPHASQDVTLPQTAVTEVRLVGSDAAAVRAVTPPSRHPRPLGKSPPAFRGPQPTRPASS